MRTSTKVILGIVCPICGTVYKQGQKYAQAWGLDSWIRQGYVKEVCHDCQLKKSH